MEGTRHGIKQKKNMVTEDDKKKNKKYMILNGSVQLINSLDARVSYKILSSQAAAAILCIVIVTWHHMYRRAEDLKPESVFRAHGRSRRI
jgi:hypothetical protein